jgi:Tfp pilus tip-associated adhesin PilY1
MDAKNIKSTLTGLPDWGAWAMVMVCLGMSPARAAVNYLNLAQSPATAAAQNIAPNLIYLLDDSGSMQFEYLGTKIPSVTGSNCSGMSNTSYCYGYPVGNSTPYNGTNYSGIAPFPALPFSSSDINAAQYRSAALNPVYYNPALTYTPWACAGPYPESSAGPSSSYTVPFTSNAAGISCHWDSNVNLWLMSDATPNKAYLNPANQGAGWRSLNVWDDGTGSSNNTTNNGYAGGITTSITAVKGAYTYATSKSGFWPAVYANYQGGSNSSIGSYQFVQICPPTSAPTTNSNGVASNLVVTVNKTSGSNQGTYTAPSALCNPPPALPTTPAVNTTYLDASGNYVYVDGSGKQTVRTYAQEMQNFANWYQYYRSHNLMALAGTSQAFMKLPTSFRVNFATLNHNSGTPFYSTTNNFDTSTGGTNQRQDFLNKLFQQPVPNSGTPSRQALGNVGNWLAQTPTSSAPWGMTPDEASAPANSGLTYLSCRQNYTVFVTDGDWNGSGPSVGNVDGNAGSTITGPNSQSYTYSAVSPYKDSYSNTLADVAMYYWLNDLQTSTGMVNNVPTNGQDPAFWQHMDTFAVGLGVQGTLNYPGDLAALQKGTKSWGDPTASGSTGVGNRIDDLWHAGIDGHGGYLSASDPVDFGNSLASTLTSIVNATQASSAVSINTQQAGQVKSGTQAYLASYHPSGWWGELAADPLVVDSSGALTIGSTANWNASCVLTGGACPSMGTNAQGVANVSVTVQAPASRTILSWDGSQGIPFEWTNLASAQQTSLNGSDGLGAIRLDYLRGGRSNEDANGGSLRDRSSVLGDIVNSSPVWVGPPANSFTDTWSDQLYTSATLPENASSAQIYSAFTSAQATRTHVVYVGANDGLLHGFRAGANDNAGNYVSTNNDGMEVLAYMPNATLLQINPYTNQNYNHQFFVDATPGPGDLFYGNQWHTWLAGGLGGGGKAMYVLDITNPTNFSESNASNLVVKELSASSLVCSNAANCNNDMGYVYGTPIIRRMHNGNWAVIWGNGYNSQSGTAAIFIASIDSSTGAWTVYELNTGYAASNDPTGQNRPDGIGYVSSADLDGDHVADYLYAGDLFGNVWRFDVTSNTVSNWKVSKFGGSVAQPLYSSVNASGTPQAITTSIQAVSIPQQSGPPRVLLQYGTGKMLEPGDQTPNPATQTIYGVWDWNMANWNSLSNVQYASLTGTQTVTRSTLQQQTVTGAYDASGNTYNGTGTGYRTLSSNPVCWKGGTSCTPSTANSKYGWYLDLPVTGEEVVFNPTVAFGVFLVNTFIPSSVSNLTCGSQPSSGFTMALDPSTGGAMQGSFFANSAGNFVTINGQVVSGMAQNAVGTPSIVTYGGQPYMVNQTAGGQGKVAPINPPGGGVGGRATWVQLR